MQLGRAAVLVGGVVCALLVVVGRGLDARPGEGPSEDATLTCLRIKMWESYDEDWQNRTLETATLQAGKTGTFPVTLMDGNRYRVLTCGDGRLLNLDVLLYNEDGEVLARDDTVDREPVIDFEVSETETYFVVLYAREMQSGAPEGEAAMAVLFQ